jgi:ribosome production factor 2
MQVIENLNLAGVDRIYVCTAISPTTVYMMHCALRLKRSGTPIPRMELVEVGPSMDLVVRRHRLPVESLKKEAMKTAEYAKKVNLMELSVKFILQILVVTLVPLALSN